MTHDQVYSVSFCNYNGDGIGDLKGLMSKFDYLKDMIVVWVSPKYNLKIPQVWSLVDVRACSDRFQSELFDEILGSVRIMRTSTRGKGPFRTGMSSLGSCISVAHVRSLLSFETHEFDINC